MVMSTIWFIIHIIERNTYMDGYLSLCVWERVPWCHLKARIAMHCTSFRFRMLNRISLNCGVFNDDVAASRLDSHLIAFKRLLVCDCWMRKTIVLYDDDDDNGKATHLHLIDFYTCCCIRVSHVLLSYFACLIVAVCAALVAAALFSLLISYMQSVCVCVSYVVHFRVQNLWWKATTWEDCAHHVHTYTSEKTNIENSAFYLSI